VLNSKIKLPYSELFCRVFDIISEVMVSKTVITVCLLAGLSCMPVTANPVSIKQVHDMVSGWLVLSESPLGEEISGAIDSVVPVSDTDSNVLYYVVSFEQGGFALTAANDEIEPLISFSSHGDYIRDADNPLTSLIDGDMHSRLDALAAVSKNTKGVSLSPQSVKWTTYINAASDPGIGVKSLDTISDVRVAALVNSHWKQSVVYHPWKACYNYYTPPYAAGATTNYPSGCTQTVWAQIMRYHRWPDTVVAARRNTITVDGVAESRWTRGVAYDWNSMPYVPTVDTPVDQRQAIGGLMYDIGVINGADYYSGGTSSGMSVDDLKNVFKYANAIYSSPGNVGGEVSYKTRVLNANMDAGLPVSLKISRVGGTHAVIADGYGYDAGTMYHHLNVGFNSGGDVWYSLPNIDAAHTYDTVYGFIYNVYKSGSGEIISGRTLNQNGTPVSNARVTITGSGVNRVTQSNINGIYAFKALPSDSDFTISATSGALNFRDLSIRTGTSLMWGACGNIWGADLQDGAAEPTRLPDPTPDPLAFGDITVGQSRDLLFRIRNNGNSTLTVVGFGCPTGYSCNWHGSVAAGALSDPINVRFTPVAPVQYNGTITITSDQTGGDSTLGVSGSGVSAQTRLPDPAPDPLSFGLVTVDTTRTLTFRIHNNGNQTLSVSGLVFPPAFSGSWKGYVAAGGTSPEIGVTFSPTALQSYSGNVTISCNNTGGDILLAVSGTGRQAVIEPTPDPLEFGNVEVGSSKTKTFRIRNNSTTLSLTVDALKYPSQYSGNWSGVIPAKQISPYITVRFRPTSLGAHGGDVILVSGKTDYPLLSLTGAGTPVQSRIISLSGNLGFAGVAIGGSSMSVLVIRNTGTTSLTVSGITYPAGFSGNRLGSVIAPGGSRSVTVVFSPTEEKSYNGVITVDSDATDGVNTRAVSGSGVSVKDIISAILMLLLSGTP